MKLHVSIKTKIVNLFYSKTDNPRPDPNPASVTKAGQTLSESEGIVVIEPEVGNLLLSHEIAECVFQLH